MTNDLLCSSLEFQERTLFYKCPKAIFTQLQTALKFQHSAVIKCANNNVPLLC